jgi:hypothetical protein
VACCQSVGINVVLNQPPSEGILAELETIGPSTPDFAGGATLGPGNPTWSDLSNVSFIPATFCWGADASGHGLIQAIPCLAATPAP